MGGRTVVTELRRPTRKQSQSNPIQRNALLDLRLGTCDLGTCLDWIRWTWRLFLFFFFSCLLVRQSNNQSIINQVIKFRISVSAQAQTQLIKVAKQVQLGKVGYVGRRKDRITAETIVSV